jgi:uncharacterized protein
MRIQLEQVRLEPHRWSEALRVPAESLEDSEILHVGEVAWQGELRFASLDFDGVPEGGLSGGFRLRGTIEYEQTVQCQRCLEPVVLPVRSEIDLTLLVDPAEVGPGEHRLEEGDLGVVYLDSDVFDLEPVILEQLELDHPMRVLCREDCRGLCPVCGANRNVETCDCAPAPDDPRWAALAHLKRDLQRHDRDD